MPLNGVTLATSEKAAILLKLQALFPVDSALTAAEQIAYNAAQDKMAEAMAGGAPETVSHITTNAVVSTTDTGVVTTGPGAGGAVTATGTGTVA